MVTAAADRYSSNTEGQVALMKSSMDPSTRGRYYRGALESPALWLFRGMQLRSASMRLDWKVFPAREDELGFDHFHEYQMLLGMSFEALLKGHITRSRLRQRETPILLQEHFVHDLKALGERRECEHLSLTPAELAVLDDLTPFIEWAGRYPLPKSDKSMEVGWLITDAEYDLQNALWSRTYRTLRDDAWYMKGGPASEGGARRIVKPDDA